MTEGKPIQIAKAKGRPMLTWVGKQPLRQVTAFPAQRIERYGSSLGELSDSTLWSDWSNAYPRGGLLFHGDNKDVLVNLLANGFRGKVQLIYIDPPFNTGVEYVRNVNLRNIKSEKITSEEYSFTEQIQYAANYYTDVFMQFLYERLQLARELLAHDGMIFIRMDVHYESHVRLIADEVFGSDLFQNTMMVNRIKKNVTDKGRRTIPNAVDYLLVYFRSLDAEYKNILKTLPETRPGYWHAMESQGVSGPRSVTIDGTTHYPSPGTHFKFPQKQADEMYSQGLIRINPSSGRPEYWVKEKDHVHLDSDWTDIPGYAFTTGYPTENSAKLLERVIEVGSKPGDLVMDFFLGSGTTVAVAQKLGRRWIGCDINKGSIQTTTKRLIEIIEGQPKCHQPVLEGEAGKVLKETGGNPTQLSFTVYRVNDYDLQIQHDEAVNLACDAIGIERTRNDAFFDGKLGKKLVRIVPFNHPITQADLEEVKRELSVRPQEDRDIVVVGLGKETATGEWLEEWNRLRKSTNVPNKIEMVELRSDPRYGGFFQHEPADGKVTVTRQDGKILVTVEDFISPTIIERLKKQAGVLTPQITDWRAMVDSVMIDLGYNGEVFNVAFADVPEKKSDLVSGKYEFQAPEGETIVAVKITDMLGEEVLKTVKI